MTIIEEANKAMKEAGEVIDSLRAALAQEQARSKRIQMAYDYANVEALNALHIPEPRENNEIGYIAGAKFIMKLWEAALAPGGATEGKING